MSVEEIALLYVGTPFVPGGRLPGVGLDCLGVVICAGRQAGLLKPWQDVSEWQTPTAAEASALLEPHAPAVDRGPVSGDILVFDVRGHAHLALMSGPEAMVHASTLALRVVWTPIDQRWRQRLAAVHSLTEGAGG